MTCPRQRSSKKLSELLHRESGLSNQCAKGSLSEFLVVRNRKASVRWVGMPENDMTAVLLIEFVSGRNALSASLPEITGSFIHQQPQ